MEKTASLGRRGVADPAVGRPTRALALDLDFTRLPRAALLAMAEAGHEVVDCSRVLAKTGDNVVGEILRDQGAFYEWNHYPKGDVYDFESHAQYYYHAHPKMERPAEHGHFHTFMRPEGIPKGIRPAPVGSHAPPADANDALSHLVAISMDDKGNAIQLFVTNRWVTGETWYAARDVIAMLDGFAVDLARPSWPANRWITAMVRLFRPQIEMLVVERDRAAAAWQRRHPENDVLEDRRLEVTAAVNISVEGQMRRIAAALRRPRR